MSLKQINSLSQELVMKSKGTMVAPREVLDKIQVLAPEALATIETLMRTAKAETVRYKAALEILNLAGVTKEHKISVTTEVQDMDEKEIDSRLGQLLQAASGVVIDHDMKETKAEVIEEVH